MGKLRSGPGPAARGRPAPQSITHLNVEHLALALAAAEGLALLRAAQRPREQRADEQADRQADAGDDGAGAVVLRDGSEPSILLARGT